MHHIYHYDPTDPMGFWYDPLPEHPTQQELEEYQRVAIKTLVRSVAAFIAMLAILAVLSLLTSCTTPKVVTVERVRTDTVRITQHERDSIFRHDSIYVRERTQGDTVILEVDRWHTQYRDRWRTDTAYISRRDSIPVPYPVDRPVPAQLSWFQQMQLWLGRLVLLALALCAGWFIVRWWLRVKRVI